jgi:ATP synthase protein I
MSEELEPGSHREKDEEEDLFVQEVRRQAERVRRGKTLSFWQGLSLAGAIGWMVSVPAVGGALLGRWIDRRSGTGIFWTLSLLVLGVGLGCATAWRHVRQELNR